MFFFGAIPVIVLGHVNAFLMVDPNQAERPEFAPYDYLRIRTKVRNQRCGSVTFWCGSGSADPCLRLMDPDPPIFVIDLQEARKKR